MEFDKKKKKICTLIRFFLKTTDPVPSDVHEEQSRKCLINATI
jgi:hypothetical protein